MKRRVRKAVFPVGGLGTRFLPATKAVPKEMLPVVDKPLIQYVVEEARAAGIEEFIFVTARGKSAVEEHFDDAPELHKVLAEAGKSAELKALETSHLPVGAAAYTRQHEALGLGHAIWCARNLVGDEPFAVLLADELFLSGKPCLQQLLELYQEVGGGVFGLAEVPREQTDRYGIVDVESDDGRVVVIRGMVEKPDPAAAPSTLSIVGRYILQPEGFAALDRQERGIGGEVQLTDSVAAAIDRMSLHGLRVEGRRFDCGDKAGLIRANVAFALARDELGDEIRGFLQECLSPH